MTPRHAISGLTLLCGLLASSAAPAQVQFSLGLDIPGLSIGVNVPSYPQMVRVPGYPVYYAPQLRTNYFFYDGMYWVYQGDDWYASDWYDGPWGRVSADVVPLFVLRVPVRYYRSPPRYFSGWQQNAAPRWGEHWGPRWESQRPGWDRWNRNAVPAPAPLPSYQRPYRADRYPQAEQQPALRGENYRYQPREPVVRQHFEAPPPVRRGPERGNDRGNERDNDRGNDRGHGRGNDHGDDREPGRKK